MDITVTIGNAKVDNIVAALEAGPASPLDIPEGADAATIRGVVAAYYADKWKDEIRQTLRQHRRQQAIQAAVDADRALPDPLA